MKQCKYCGTLWTDTWITDEEDNLPICMTCFNSIFFHSEGEENE